MNVLASAFGTRGLCADVLRTALAEHDLITSEFVLAELERVLSEQFGLPLERINAVLTFLRRFRVEPTPGELPSLRIRDADDMNVIASAIASGADVLVTGDQDLLSVRDQVAIATEDPRGFWSMLTKRGRT